MHAMGTSECGIDTNIRLLKGKNGIVLNKNIQNG